MELDHEDQGESLLEKHAETVHPSQPQGNGHAMDYKDKPFAMAFGVNVGVVVFIAVRYICVYLLQFF